MSTVSKLNALFEEEDANLISDRTLMTSTRMSEVWNNTRNERKARMHEPDVQAKLSAASLKGWANPIKKEKQRTSLKTTLATPEAKIVKSKATQMLWKNDDYRSKVSNGVKSAMQNEEYKKKHSEATKKALSTPEAKRKMAEARERIKASGILRPIMTKEEKSAYKKALKKGPIENNGKISWAATARLFSIHPGRLRDYANGRNLRDLE